MRELEKEGYIKQERRNGGVQEYTGTSSVLTKKALFQKTNCVSHQPQTISRKEGRKLKHYVH